MRTLRYLLVAIVVATAGAAGVAGAHASLDASSPGAGAVLDAAPSEVRLSFSENVEVAFSVFGVHRLEAKVDMSEQRAQQRINGLAAPLVEAWLDQTAEDGSLVPTTLEPSVGAAAEIALVLADLQADGLEAGHYVVVWRVLSADTHPVEGYFTFTIMRE